MIRTTLSVLDLSPISSGSDAAAALGQSVELAQQAEDLGYSRIWFAEHHLTPGVASSAPAVLAALVAERTRHIRVGSGAVLLAHTSATQAVEQSATIARLHLGRVDLGLGRASTPPAAGAATPAAGATRPAEARPGDREVDGVLIPAAPPSGRNTEALVRWIASHQRIVGPRANAPSYREELTLALQLLGAGHRDEAGLHASPVASGADLELWSLASSGGESATVAGELGLPLVANYHVSPATVLDTVVAYRAAFRPGVRAEPYVAVSADVVVADTTPRAREFAAGYGTWVLSVREARGAIPYPNPEEAAAHPWDEESRALVRDRVQTQFVGDAEGVGDGLRALAAVTGADELFITTITHNHLDRLRSYALLARAWDRVPVHA